MLLNPLLICGLLRANDVLPGRSELSIPEVSNLVPIIDYRGPNNDALTINDAISLLKVRVYSAQLKYLYNMYVSAFAPTTGPPYRAAIGISFQPKTHAHF